MPPASAEDHALAAHLAAEAGRFLVALRTEAARLEPDELRAEGDRRSHELLVQRLGEVRPDDGVLSEEGNRAGARPGRLWVIDPLDGTREYGEPGRSDWAVHVALVIDGELVAGAVALPAESAAFSTEHPPAAPVRKTGSVVTSRSRRPAAAERVAEAIGASTTPLGSAGVKAMAVVRGQADAYVHAGGMYVWDLAAPVAVAWAAGLHASRIDGSPLYFGSGEPSLPDVLICPPDLAERCLAALAGP